MQIENLYVVIHKEHPDQIISDTVFVDLDNAITLSDSTPNTEATTLKDAIEKIKQWMIKPY